MASDELHQNMVLLVHMTTNNDLIPKRDGGPVVGGAANLNWFAQIVATSTDSDRHWIGIESRTTLSARICMPLSDRFPSSRTIR